MNIYRANGNVACALQYIPEGSVLHRELMGDHYVRLPFTLATPVYFRLGDYITTDFGRFEVTEPCLPKFNQETGGYDYTLVLEAYYMKWRNKTVKYYNSSTVQLPTETSFKLTTKPAVHMNVVLSAINALGAQDSSFLYNGNPYTWAFFPNFPTDKMDSAKFLFYDNLSILDALGRIAALYDCEYWVEGGVIYLGRCESGTEFDMELGENVEEMSGNESKNEYANRLYVFGSTRNIPKDYRQSLSPDTINGIAEKRLMLPYSGTHACPKGYVQSDDVTNESEAVEAVVVNEDIYPKLDCWVSRVESYTKSETIDGQTVTKTFYRVYDGSGFVFDNETMIIPGLALHILFQSGSMNGMDFECYHDDTDGYYEIKVNEDYGRELPDVSLHPAVNDHFVLYNWDATQLTGEDDIVADAEDELYQFAMDKLEQTKIDPNVYTCTMMSDAYSEVSTHYPLGQKVKLINPARFQNGRSSRIIGYEFNLDIVYDHAKYIVGEATRYSKTDDLQSQVDAAKYSGKSYFTKRKIWGQDYDGTSDITGPFILGNIMKRYDESLKAWVLEAISTRIGQANLVVEGGITAYASNAQPDSWVDAIPIDNDTIVWDNGVLKATPSSGSEFDEDAMWEILSSYDGSHSIDIDYLAGFDNAVLDAMSGLYATPSDILNLSTSIAATYATIASVGYLIDNIELSSGKLYFKKDVQVGAPDDPVTGDDRSQDLLVYGRILLGGEDIDDLYHPKEGNYSLPIKASMVTSSGGITAYAVNEDESEEILDAIPIDETLSKENGVLHVVSSDIADEALEKAEDALGMAEGVGTWLSDKRTLDEAIADVPDGMRMPSFVVNYRPTQKTAFVVTITSNDISLGEGEIGVDVTAPDGWRDNFFVLASSGESLSSIATRLAGEMNQKTIGEHSEWRMLCGNVSGQSFTVTIDNVDDSVSISPTGPCSMTINNIQPYEAGRTVAYQYSKDEYSSALWSVTTNWKIVNNVLRWNVLI